MKLLYSSIAILYITAIVTIYLSAHVAGYETLLAQMSCENGLFESVGSIALSIASLYALYSLLKYRFTDMDRAILVILSILFFLASMEEISWGQHIFHFPSSRYFLENNLQEETNLHNLIDGNIFSSIIYSTIYIFLIYIPIILKLYPKLISRVSILRYFDFNPHIIATLLFASSFQLYFYKDFGVYMDMFSYLVGVILFIYYSMVSNTTTLLKLHIFAVIFGGIISMLSYRVFSFYNMQYELRESFIEIALLLILIEFIGDREV